MKKILALLLCIALVFSFSACKGKNDNTGGNDSSVISNSDVSSNSSTASTDSDDSSSSSSSGSSSSNISSTFLDDDEVDIDKIVSDNNSLLSSTDLKKAVKTTYKKPKNVIIMIADGMGPNDIKVCQKFSTYQFKYGLSFTYLPNRGYAVTDSLSAGATDSAASATALATGSKTHNGYLGMLGANTTLKNASEVAREQGKRVGIVTTDPLSGATPAGFSVHNTSRYNTDQIANSLIAFAPDVAIGNSNFHSSYASKMSHFNLAVGVDTFKSAIASDPTFSKPFFGFDDFQVFSNSDRLATATSAALSRLENDKGFFLMVEHSGPDNAGHNGNLQGKVNSVASFDKAVAVAIKYCLKHPDTVLIVTSDHDNGGLILPNKDTYELSDVRWTSNVHTDADVRVFGLGYGTEIFKGKTVDNTDIGKFLIAAIKGKTYKI